MKSRAKKDKALRYNKGKLRLHLVPEEAIEGLARGFMAGEKKYPKFNYRKGMPILEATDSLRRHMLAFLKGQNIDEETGFLTPVRKSSTIFF